jgi:hypothetical protein
MSSSTQVSFTPTPSPSQTNGSNPGPMSKDANYFFGFLIAFVALLLLLVSCGFASRRFAYRRRMAALEMGLDGTAGPWRDDDPWQLGSVTQQSRPMHWDAWMGPSIDKDSKWVHFVVNMANLLLVNGES